MLLYVQGQQLSSCQDHQDNMSLCLIPPYTPILYSKTGVYRGLHHFLIFALKHILWVLVRTASEAVLTCTHNICFGQKYENSKNISNEAVLTSTHNICFEQKYENSQNVSTKNSFLQPRKSLYVAWACFRNDCQSSNSHFSWEGLTLVLKQHSVHIL